jgi:hypothetical protein
MLVPSLERAEADWRAFLATLGASTVAEARAKNA